jgi:hypothetical protein
MKLKLLGFLAALALPMIASSQVTLTAAQTQALSKGQSVTLTITGTASNVTPPVTPPVVVVPPTPVTPVSTGKITGPVFVNGQFYWAGDWSNVTMNYTANIAGVSGPGPVIQMPSSSPWEYWLPYPKTVSGSPASNGIDYNLSGKTYMTFAIKPTQAGAAGSLGFYKANGATDDISTGNSVTFPQAKYGCATLVVNQWNVCTIPLSDFGVSGWIYKFILQQQGTTPQTWYLDQVGFE